MANLYSAATIASLAIVPPCVTVLAFLATRLAWRQVLLHRRVNALRGPCQTARAVWLRASF